MYDNITATFTSNYSDKNADSVEHISIDSYDIMVNEDNSYDYKSFIINFDSLKNMNNEVVAWIRFDDGSINYPLLQSDNNLKYLSTGADGGYNRGGAIFLDCRNENLNDYHILIYGHNMKDGSMFGKLKKFNSDKEYANKNKYFSVYTQEKALRYKVFAYYTVNSTDDKIYLLGFSPNEEYQHFIDNIIKRNNCLTDDIPTIQDRIITLSTCSGSDSRFIVNAYLVEEYNY